MLKVVNCTAEEADTCEPVPSEFASGAPNCGTDDTEKIKGTFAADVRGAGAAGAGESVENAVSDMDLLESKLDETLGVRPEVEGSCESIAIDKGEKPLDTDLGRGDNGTFVGTESLDIDLLKSKLEAALALMPEAIADMDRG